MALLAGFPATFQLGPQQFGEKTIRQFVDNLKILLYFVGSVGGFPQNLIFFSDEKPLERWYNDPEPGEQRRPSYSAYKKSEENGHKNPIKTVVRLLIWEDEQARSMTYTTVPLNKKPGHPDLL